MRREKQKSTQKTLLINVARIAVLALCFTLVLGFTLGADAAGVFGDYNYADSSLDVGGSSGDDATTAAAGIHEVGGNALVDGASDVTATSLKASNGQSFPGKSSGNTVFTQTVQYPKAALSESEVSGYMKSDTSNDILLESFGVNQGENIFTVRETEQHGAYSPDMYGCININVGTFLENLIKNNSNVTVKARVSGTVVRYHGAGNINMAVAAYNAPQLASAKKNGTDKGWLSQSSSGSKDYSGEVTLTQSEPVLTIFVFTDSGWTRTMGVSLRNVSVTYTVTLGTPADNSAQFINDNSAPVLSTSSEAWGKIPGMGATDNRDAYGHVMTSEMATGNDPVWGWNVGDASWFNASWYNSILPYLKYDSPEQGILQTYWKDPINASGQQKGGKDYYKSVKRTYVDTYNYSNDNVNDFYDTWPEASKDATGTKGYGDRTDVRYCAGIKKVKVGNTDFNVYGATSTASGQFTAVVNDVEVVVGYAEIKKLNRARVEVQVYVYSNANFSIGVYDYGDLYIADTMRVSGIDTTKPYSTGSGLTLDTDENYVSSSFGGNFNWWNSKSFANGVTANIPETDVTGTAPYLWYYSAQRKDTPFTSADQPYPLSTLAGQINSLTPISARNFANFQYDFNAGVASGVGGSASNPAGKVTGAGYYMFTFYAMDLAGNVSDKVVTYYAKADYIAPSYTLKYTFTGIDGNAVNITPDSEDGTLGTNGSVWATSAASLAFTFTPTLSGNMFYFENLDGNDCYITLSNGKITLVTSVSPSSIGSNGTSATINLGANTINVSYSLDGNGVATLTLVYGSVMKDDGTNAFEEIDQRLTFYTIVGTNLDAESFIMYYDNSWTYQVSKTKRTTGVALLVDRNIPDEAVLMQTDGGSNLHDFTADGIGDLTALPKAGDWYTKGWDYNYTQSFNDQLISTYGADIKIYIAMRNVTQIGGLGNKNGENTSLDYFVKNYKMLFQNDRNCFNTASAWQTYFDSLTINTGTQSEGEFDSTLGLLQSLGAGMRVLFVWAVDQAGNCSGIVAYNVFADANSYKIQASVDNQADVGGNFGANTAKISVADSDGVAKSVFKRGDNVKLTVNFGNNLGYVPYMLTRNVFEKDAILMLQNLSPRGEWGSTGNAYEAFISWSADGNGAYVQDIILDDADNYKELLISNSASESTKTIAYEFKYRKVLSYVVTNKTIGFTGGGVIVPLAYSDDSAKAKEAFIATYFETATATEAMQNAPVSPRDDYYYVEISIDGSNTLYVLDSDVQRTAFKIVKGVITIAPKNQTSVYGDGAFGQFENGSGNYTVSGLDNPDALAALSGKFKVNVTEGDLARLNVGQYQIIHDGDFYFGGDFTGFNANYTFKYESAYFQVTQKNITISPALGQFKYYLDVEPELLFTIDTAQFVNQDAWDKIFLNIGEKKSESGTVFTFGSNGNLSRDSGEDVGSYFYSTSVSRFVVNENYKLSIELGSTAGAKFVINKKTVNVSVKDGQYSILSGFNPAETGATDNIHPAYTLTGDNAKYAGYINGSLDLGTYTTDDTGTDYNLYVYAIVNNLTGGTNIEIQITGSNYNYVIKVPKADNLVYIKAKTDSKAQNYFKSPYGNSINKYSFKYNPDAFTISATGSYDVNNIAGVDWEIQIDASNSTPYVGNYIINVNNITLTDNAGNAITGLNAVCEPFEITVTEADIIVVPVAKSFNRVYGENDGAYGIGFEIASINGNTDVNAFLNGLNDVITLDTLLSEINGAFARAVCSADRGFIANGAQYDTVTDADGFVENTLRDRYYNWAVSKDFACTDSNFKVTPDVSAKAADRFTISKKQIVLDETMFLGVSKQYDNTSNVTYPANVTAVDLTGKLAYSGDDVKVTFDAFYSNAAGLPVSVIGEHKITFQALGLGGLSSVNYVLMRLNTLGDLVQVNADTTFRISTISASSTETIKITDMLISAYVNDFTISKQYDNTRELRPVDITVDSASGAAIFGNLTMYVTAGLTAFSGTVPGTYLIQQLQLYFELGKDIDENLIVIQNHVDDDGLYSCFVEYFREYEGHGNGLLVTLRAKSATIVKRVINGLSFDTINAVDRDYDGSQSIEINYAFKPDAYAQNEADKVKLVLSGQTIDDANAGTHAVKFVKATLGSQNYSVDIDDLNAYFSDKKQLEATIDKAKLIPVLNIQDKQYDGISAIAQSGATGKFVVCDANGNMRSVLDEELSKLSFDAGVVTFVYSANGVANADVNVEFELDENGLPIFDEINGVYRIISVKRHNVLVDGLSISATDSNILRNYVLYGSQYANGKYGALTGTSANGAYEILEYAVLERSSVSFISNDVEIPDKVYDGNRDSGATIDISGNGKIPDSERNNLVINATAVFSSPNVSVSNSGTSLKISNPKIELSDNSPLNLSAEDFGKLTEDEKDALALRIAQYLSNYRLMGNNSAADLKAKITPAPIVFSADLGDKTYDGSEKVGEGKVSYVTPGYQAGSENFGGFKNASDNRNYAFTTGSAYFVSKNVNIKLDDAGENVTEILNRDGTVYDFNLVNRRDTGIVNYAPAFVSKDGGLANEADGISLLQIETRSETVNSVVQQVKYYYYTLPSTSKYIEASALSSAPESLPVDGSDIIGYYIYKGTPVYLLKQSTSTTENVKSMDASVTYINSAYAADGVSGMITRKSVSIVIEKVEKSEGANPFEKYYDGTNVFFGNFKDDFRIAIKGASNTNLDLTISNGVAQFRSSSAGTTQLVISELEFSGVDKWNYYYDSSKITSSIPAKILQRELVASLANQEMSYGDEKTFKPSYAVAGNDYVIEEYNERLYMSLTSYLAWCGLTDNESVKAQLTSFCYNKVDGAFIQADNGDYIKIGGDSTFNLPKVSIASGSIGSATPAGAYNFIMSSGSATNFSFVTATSSKLTVNRAKVYVYVKGNYFRQYKEGNPSIVLAYLDELGKSAFKRPGETAASIFGANNLPEVKFMFFNGTEYVEMSDSSLITADLSSGQYYTAVISLSGVSSSLINSNYELISTVNLSYVNDEGNVVDGKSLLTVTLPDTIDGVACESKNELTYSGSNLANALISGLKDGDKLYVREHTADDSSDFVLYSGDLSAFGVDVGTYFVDVKAERPFANDVNNYASTLIVSNLKLDIIAAKAGMSVELGTKTYNGQVVYNTDNVASIKDKITTSIGNATFPRSAVKISFQRYVGNGYVGVNEIKDAGTYRVLLSYTASDTATEDVPANKNFLDETDAMAIFIVNPAEFVVVISQNTPTTQAFVSTAETKLDYTLSAAQTAAETLPLPATTMKYYFGSTPVEITKAGIYTYKVAVDPSLNAGNYKFNGGSGQFTVGYRQLSTDTSSNITGIMDATISSGDKLMIVTDFVCRSIGANNQTVEDDYVWASVNGLMPMIGSVGNSANLASIVRMSLSYNGVAVVNLDQKVQISVAIPQNVGSMDNVVIYATNADGGLTKVKEYTVSNGKITYSTDYIGSLVFVKMGDELPIWAIVIIALGGAALLVGVILGAVFGVRKKKRQSK